MVAREEVVVQVLALVSVLEPVLVLVLAQVSVLVSALQLSEIWNARRALFQFERCELQSAQSFSLN